MALPSLSLIISHHNYLSDQYLKLQIDALNRQTSKDFQVFYLNQAPTADLLLEALQAALFPFRVIQLQFPWLEATCCWDLVSVMGQLLAQPVHGPYMSYLHQECLPAADFVKELLSGIQASEKAYGNACVYRLNQLHCQQTPEQLGAFYLRQLAQSQPISWIERTPYQASYQYALRPWSEDAFALHVAWVNQSQLFSAVSFPLFFQDLFDIFYQFPNLPALAETTFVHLGKPVIYHLNHARAFREYRQAFLKAVRQHPEWFGHLALYELAEQHFDYQEGFEQGERMIPAHLHRFVHYMRYAENGTVSLWRQALLRTGTEAQARGSETASDQPN